MPIKHLLGTLLLLVVLLASASLSLGQSRRLPAKRPKPKPMLTLTNPVSGIKVVFQDPAFIDEPLGNSGWKKLSVYLPGQAKPLILEACEDSGYMICDNEDQWSLDGIYMTVWNIHIISEVEYSDQRITFIKLEDATEVRFSSKKGLEVSMDNFWGWVKDKPHVIIKGTGTPGVSEEARDIWD